MSKKKRAKPRELIVNESQPMRSVVDQVEDLAECDAPVLIEGEPGTGRELLARVIHLVSPRRSRELVAVKAGIAPKEIFTDPIEGSSNSAFRRASGGTLLVKDLLELSRMSQRKLNKALREPSRSKAIARDVRVLGTAGPDLEGAVEAEVFNRVLYNRLSLHKITVPPLRERVPDIPPLAAQMIQQYAREIGRKRITVATRAYDRLVTYPWPGNVAELKVVCRRLVIRAKRSRIEAADVEAVLPFVAERVPLEEMSFEDMVRAKLTSFLKQVEGYPIDGLHEQVVSRVEKPLLEMVLDYTGGNQLKAADILGLNRNTLRRKLNDHGLQAKAAKRTVKKKSSKSKAAAAAGAASGSKESG